MSILSNIKALTNPNMALELIQKMRTSNPQLYVRVMSAQVETTLKKQPLTQIMTFTQNDHSIQLRYCRKDDGTGTLQSNSCNGDPAHWFDLDTAAFHQIIGEYNVKLA